MGMDGPDCIFAMQLKSAAVENLKPRETINTGGLRRGSGAHSGAMSEESNAIDRRRTEVRQNGLYEACVGAVMMGCFSGAFVLLAVPKLFPKLVLPVQKQVFLVTLPTMAAFLQRGISAQAPAGQKGKRLAAPQWSNDR